MRKIITILLFIIIMSSLVYAGGGGIQFNFNDEEADYYSQHLLMLEITVNDNYKFTLFSDGEVHFDLNNNEIKTYKLGFDDVKAISETFNNSPFGGSGIVNDGNKYKIDYYLSDSESLAIMGYNPVNHSYDSLSYELKDAVYTIIKGSASDDGSLMINLEKEKPVLYEGFELKKVTLFLNGKKFYPASNQMPAVIFEGRTLVPVREVFEKLDGVVKWDDYSKKVTVSFGEKTIELTIDSLTAKVDGNEIALDVPAKIINSKTMVPVRFISEQGGLNVEWDGATETVSISKIAFTSLNSIGTISLNSQRFFLNTSIEVSKIKEISFANSINGHVVDGSSCFDVSDDNSNSILLWVDNIDKNGLYTVTISQNGLIAANESSSSLFRDMTNLEKINNLEYLDTSKVKYMSNMFNNCKKLKSLNLSKFNTANVSNMDNMFDGCELLETLDLSSFNTKRVTSMKNMFSDCKKLKNLNLKSFETTSVTYMNDMFNGCTNLNEIDLSSFKRINKIDNMFKNCSNLRTIYVSNNLKMTYISTIEGKLLNGEDVFVGCTKLVGGKGTKYNAKNVGSEYAKVDGGNDNPGYFTLVDTNEATENVYATIYETSSSSDTNKEYELHFSTSENKLKNLNEVYSRTITKNTRVNINQSLWGDYTDDIVSVVFDDVVRPYNTDSWFYGCRKLTKIENMEKLDTSYVTSMKSMFDGCSSLTQIDLSHFDTSNVTNMERLFHYCSKLQEIDVSRFDTSKVTNMSYMFGECDELLSLDLRNFDTSNVTNMTFMFSYFEKMTSLDLSNFDTHNVEDMSRMFISSHSLTNINISSFNTSKVTTMEGMFAFCTNLSSIDTSRFDTSNVTDMGFMFSECKKITTLDLGNFNTSKVTKMNSMFSQCVELTSLNVSSFDTSNVTDMSYMFNYLNKITELDISNFDTHNTVDMDQMFGYCYLLKTIYVSENFVTDKLLYGKGFSMFINDVSLVGGMGTKFDKGVTDNFYANIDAENLNGYFTKKN